MEILLPFASDKKLSGSPEKGTEGGSFFSATVALLPPALDTVMQ